MFSLQIWCIRISSDHLYATDVLFSIWDLQDRVSAAAENERRRVVAGVLRYRVRQAPRRVDISIQNVDERIAGLRSTKASPEYLRNKNH